MPQFVCPIDTCLSGTESTEDNRKIGKQGKISRVTGKPQAKDTSRHMTHTTTTTNEYLTHHGVTNHPQQENLHNEDQQEQQEEQQEHLLDNPEHVRVMNIVQAYFVELFCQLKSHLVIEQKWINEGRIEFRDFYRNRLSVSLQRKLEACPDVQEEYDSLIQQAKFHLFKMYFKELKALHDSSKASMRGKRLNSLFDRDHAIIRKAEPDMVPSDDEDDENVENESDDEIQMIPQKKKTMNNTDQDDDESDDESDDDESSDDEDAKESIGKVSSNQWKKSDYYQQQKQQQQQQNNKKKSNNSQYDERQEQYEQDEEAEVLEIQKKRASRLNNQYVLDDLLLSTTDSQNKKNKKQKTDESDNEQEDEDEEQQQQQMNKNQKMKLIMKESPELIQLFTELKDRLQVVRDQIHPILSKVESQEYATRDGLSYLETKLHLLLSYCTHILYYMLLKTSGKSVRDHPVIEKLVEMRLYLEKMKPIDDRMKSQIAKLISLVNDAVPIPSTTTTTTTTTTATKSSSSSSSAHKPRPGQLVGEKDGVDDESSTDDEHVEESDDDDEMMADDFDFNGGENGGGGEDDDESDDDDDDETNVYTAPKLMPVAYDNASVKKAKSDMKRLEKKIRNSEMIKAFKAEMGDEPEEMTNIGSEIKQSSLLKDREDYETETFTRRNLTKKEKRMLRDEQDRTVDELRNLESFTDIQALEKYSKAKNTTNTKVTLAQYMGDADKAEEDLSKMNGEGSDDDNDVDNQLDEDEQFLRASGVITEYSDSDFDEEEEEDEEADEEAPVVKSKNSNNNNNKVGDKRKRIESSSMNNNNKKKKRSTIRDEEDAMLESEYSGTGKRAATKEIVENKGLVSRKKKDYKNPRVKHKMRFANKAGSMLKMQKVQKGGQTGSVKSVNKSVVRSKKLRA